MSTTTPDIQTHLGRVQVDSIKIGNGTALTGGAWTQVSVPITNATLGAGAVNQVRYMLLGKLCIAEYLIAQTGTGPAAGTLTLGLPVPARSVLSCVGGSGVLFATAGTAVITPTVESQTTIQLFATTSAAGPSLVSDSVFGIDDNATWRLTAMIMYETA